MTRIQRLKREQKQLVKRITDTEAMAKQYTDKAAALRHLLILNGRALMSSQPASQPASQHYVQIDWTSGDRKGVSCQYSEYMTHDEASKLAKRLNSQLASNYSYQFSVASQPASELAKRPASQPAKRSKQYPNRGFIYRDGSTD